MPPLMQIAYRCDGQHTSERAVRRPARKRIQLIGSNPQNRIRPKIRGNLLRTGFLNPNLPGQQRRIRRCEFFLNLLPAQRLLRKYARRKRRGSKQHKKYTPQETLHDTSALIKKRSLSRRNSSVFHLKGKPLTQVGRLHDEGNLTSRFYARGSVRS